MVSRRLFLLSVIVLVGLGGIAIAAAIKVDLVPALIPPDDPDSGAYGQAVLKYVRGPDKTMIRINCGGLTPGEEYQVGLFYYGSLGNVTAGNNGKIALHVRIPGDVSGFDPGVYRIADWHSVLVPQP